MGMQMPMATPQMMSGMPPAMRGAMPGAMPGAPPPRLSPPSRPARRRRSRSKPKPEIPGALNAAPPAPSAPAVTGLLQPTPYAPPVLAPVPQPTGAVDLLGLPIAAPPPAQAPPPPPQEESWGLDGLDLSAGPAAPTPSGRLGAAPGGHAAQDPDAARRRSARRLRDGGRAAAARRGRLPLPDARRGAGAQHARRRADRVPRAVFFTHAEDQGLEAIGRHHQRT